MWRNLYNNTEEIMVRMWRNLYNNTEEKMDRMWRNLYKKTEEILVGIRIHQIRYTEEIMVRIRRYQYDYFDHGHDGSYAISWNSLKCCFNCTSATGCGRQLGMISGDISDFQIDTSIF
jgi:hypothetical protein